MPSTRTPRRKRHRVIAHGHWRTRPGVIQRIHQCRQELIDFDQPQAVAIGGERTPTTATASEALIKSTS